MFDRLLEKLAESGPLAVLFAYVLIKMDRTMAGLRDSILELIGSRKEGGKK